MKDKEKQIEEIKRIIDNRCEAELGQVHASSNGGKVTKTVDTKLIAKDIYEYLTKDSVVLSKEEYEKLTTSRVYIAEKIPTNKELTEMLDKSMYSVIQDTSTVEIIPTRAEIEKETAGKILNEVSKHYGGAWLVALYKQFGIEIEE